MTDRYHEDTGSIDVEDQHELRLKQLKKQRDELLEKRKRQGELSSAKREIRRIKTERARRAVGKGKKVVRSIMTGVSKSAETFAKAGKRVSGRRRTIAGKREDEHGGIFGPGTEWDFGAGRKGGGTVSMFGKSKIGSGVGASKLGASFAPSISGMFGGVSRPRTRRRRRKK